MSRSQLGRVALVLGLGPVVFGAVTLVTLARGEAQMRASDAVFDAGELEPALRHARAAIALYVPGADHVDRGYERLRAIAAGAERARDLELARLAWRAVRGAAIETTHVWAPREHDRAEAERALARLGEGEASTETPRGLTRPLWVAILVGAFVAIGISVRELLGRCFSEVPGARRLGPLAPALILLGSLLTLCVALLRA